MLQSDRLCFNYMLPKRIIIQMIQTQTCPNCYTEIATEDFRDHSQSCSQNQSVRSRSNGSVKAKQKRIYLNVQLMRPYFIIKKFRNTIFQKVQGIIHREFDEVIKQFKIILTPQEAYLQILSQKQSLYMLNQLEALVENQINSYEVLNFKIEDTHSKVLFNLEDQFIFEEKGPEIYFIQKKSVILQKIVQFFSAMLSLQKVSKKFDLGSEILEVDEDKQKQVLQLTNFIYEFIAQKEHLTIKTKKTQKKCFVFISGLEQPVKSCKQYLQESLSGVDCMELARYKISEEEYKIIKREKILQKFKQEIGLKYEIKNFVISKTFHVNKKSTIHLLCNRNLFTIPRTSVIILPQSLMKEVKQAQQSMNCLKEYIFFSPEEGKQVLEAIEEFISFYIQEKGQLGVILPELNKQNFMERIINFLKTQSKSITIYFLERSDQKLAVQALKQSASQRIWYTYVKQQKTYYPQKVCQKIEEGLLNKLDRVQITHEDLDIKTKTHIYNPEEGVIVDQKSKFETNVEDQGNSLVAFLAQGCYTIKKTKEDKQVTFGVYELDLKNYIQRNILSEKKRKINSEQKKEKSNKIEDQKTEIELVLRYPDRESMEHVWREIQKTVGNQKIHKQISIQGIQKQKISHIVNWCKLNKIQIMIDGKQLQANSYYQSAIVDLEKLIQLHKKKLLSGAIQYPPFWVEDQEAELNLYSIKQKSEQFTIVQKNFKVGKIKKLQRIQNKLLFDKYSLEKKFLEQQNGQKIRQIMMYHGTRGNQPSKIYADREESFNINYANMGSFGKGIYFAKNSEYSNNYCFMSKGGKQMFYCLVLAGHSQVYNGKQQLDTNFRDPVKKIRYESVTDHLPHQTIIVVFKNRRAYPLYLITY